MKKIGSVALAVGVASALLLGGGTSLALWNGQVSAGEIGTLATGELTLQAAEGRWSPELDLWVPGDAIEYSTTIDIVASGDNLSSHLSVDHSSITGDPQLIDALNIDLTVSNVSGGTIAETDVENVFTVSADTPTNAEPMTATATVRVSFPMGEASGKIAQGTTADLSGMQLKLEQVISQ